MRCRSLDWIPIIFLMVLACGDNDPSLTAVPEPQTADDLIVADCHEIQAALEAYASEHGGLFPGGFGDSDVHAMQTSLLRPNRYTGLMTEPRLLGQDRRWPGQIGVTFFQELSAYGEEPWGSTEVHGYRITGHGAYGIIITLENTTSVSPDALRAYDVLEESINLVAAALERFAVEHGVYPAYTNDRTRLGNTFIDFLPGGRLLTNPISGIEDSPVDGFAAAPGQIGYTPQDHGGGMWDDYDGDVRGPDGVSRIFSFRGFSDEDASTRAWMVRVQTAIETFKVDSGHYPNDVSLDQTPAGETVIDLLTGRFGDFKNPYTGAPALPVDGLASTPGNIGYLPVIENDTAVGYIINGFGILEEFYRIEMLP